MESSECCLKCRGEERCSWHTDVRVTDARPFSSGNKNVERLQPLKSKTRNVVANLPRELFYSYNPSGPSIPGYNVLPLPGTSEWEENIQMALSLEGNKHLQNAFEEMRRRGKFEPVKFPSIRNYRFKNYHVRYVEVEPKKEWRLYRPDTVPVPKECGNAVLTVKAFM